MFSYLFKYSNCKFSYGSHTQTICSLTHWLYTLIPITVYVSLHLTSYWAVYSYVTVNKFDHCRPILSSPQRWIARTLAKYFANIYWRFCQRQLGALGQHSLSEIQIKPSQLIDSMPAASRSFTWWSISTPKVKALTKITKKARNSFMLQLSYRIHLRLLLYWIYVQAPEYT